VRRVEGKRPLGKPRCRWKNNIKIHVREIWWGVMGWQGPAAYIKERPVL
jgi:hypothetical protein